MGKVRDEELADMAFVMGDPRGRRFIYRMLAVYGLERSVVLYHPPGIRAEERLLYNGAQQEVAQAIKSEALACDGGLGKLYLQMLSEAQTKRVTEELERRKREAEELRKKKEQGDDGSDGDSRSDDPSSGT